MLFNCFIEPKTFFKLGSSRLVDEVERAFCMLIPVGLNSLIHELMSLLS